MTLRPRTPHDLPFLHRLYATTRAQELAGVAWPDAMKQAFLNDQFRLQDGHYTTHYPGAAFNIIECAGQPVGRLYLFHGQTDLRVIDLSLLPDYCGRGIGTGLLQTVQAAAAQSQQTVSLHVDVGNPSITIMF